MYDQLREETLYIMLYAAVTMLSLIACCYLLFRRGNAFAPDITPPVRLRRWMAALFASMTLSHVVYLPEIYLTSDDDILLCNLIGGLIDSITCFPLAIIVLFTIMQDRRRPLWPVAVMVAPLIVGMVWCVVSRSDALIPTLFGYLLLMSIGLIIYMVREVKRYGRWLRDNYADLEHKEVWQTFVVLAVVLLAFCIYAFSSKGLCYEYLLQLIVVVLIGYLLWRVETLSDLSLSQPLPSPVEEETITPQTTYEYIAPLLQQHCIETQLYLQHDLTLQQLAKAVGTNRFYLSQYFSAQGTNYNAYINDLRIKHFINLYHETIAKKRNFSTQLLAQESGYRSYSTFCRVFKGKTGMSVTAWMKTLDKGSGESSGD